ncbi:hypothetical protein ACVJGD_005498 [Bradyrhizobium sp. USDA 10063]
MAVLSRLFRQLFLSALQKSFDTGELQFFSSLEPLRDPVAFQRYLNKVRRINWVVYAGPPFGSAEQVVHYVGRYTHRVAISNSRIVDIEDGRVRFRWKDYRHGSQQKVMTLDAGEFIRRFLIHILPEGFKRIRYYGFLGNRYRKQKLARCRELLGMISPALIRSRKSHPIAPRRLSTALPLACVNVHPVIKAEWYASRSCSQVRSAPLVHRTLLDARPRSNRHLPFRNSFGRRGSR